MKACWVVTGASGFVGKPLCDVLESRGYKVLRLVRQAKTEAEKGIGEIGPHFNWEPVLSNCWGVIHLAARVHMMSDKATDPLTEYRKVNTAGTLELAKQAAKLGVRRFIFVSSIKVNGESGRFSHLDNPAPIDPYSVSKFEAEEGLKKISEKTGMEFVVLRPPLIYGPEVRANFYNLMQAIDRGLPLPLGRVDNRRSLIFLGNFIDTIQKVMDALEAAGKTYLVSDNEVVSTSDLIRSIAQVMGRRPRLLNIPPRVIEIAARLIRKEKVAERLMGDLEIDNSAIRGELNWQPPYTLHQGLVETVKWYMSK